MNRTSTLLSAGVALALAGAAPAVAKPKPTPTPGPYACIPKAVGYSATGTLVTDGLTQTAGQSTAKTGDDRFSGDLTVAVTRANHKGAKSEVTYTLVNARVGLHPHAATAAPGDRVKIKGRITKTSKKCAATPTVTVRRVDFKQHKG